MGGVLLGFYNFKSERLYMYIWDVYIKLYKLQENVWQWDFKGLDDMFPIEKILYFFKSFVPCGTFLTNCPLLIMDGHGSHVTL